jgi:hypothetical protein
VRIGLKREKNSNGEITGGDEETMTLEVIEKSNTSIPCVFVLVRNVKGGYSFHVKSRILKDPELKDSPTVENTALAT